MTELKWLGYFSMNLKGLLRENFMNQEDLSEDGDLPKSVVSKCANGEVIPSVRTAVNMAYALNCTLDELLDFGETIN